MKAIAQGVLALVMLMALVVVARADTPLPARGDRSVYDQAGVIDPEQEATLEALHRELLAKTGAAIVIITVPQLVDETIEDFAVRVGQTWGVGKKEDDRGLVIAFSKNDRQIFVATGYGLEGILPDGRVGAVIDQRAIPQFRENRFSEGLLRVSLALAEVIAADQGVALEAAPQLPIETPGLTAKAPPRPLTIFLWVLVGLGLLYLLVRHPGLFMMLVFSGLGRGRGGGGFGGGDGFDGFGGGGFGGGGARRAF